MANHNPSNEIQKWADDAMFTAERVDSDAGPSVMLLGAPVDPLGQIAACAKMYKGEVCRSLADITDEERREYLREMQKTKLKMPLEAVSLHFMIENVTRGFTHQLVRQRTAAYAQESTRFAVKEDMFTGVGRPPSLAGTTPLSEFAGWDGPAGDWTEERWNTEYDRLPLEQKMRHKWDEAVECVSRTYNELVNMGMPAEDARGLMPTNVLTRTNYITNLRGLLDHAGNRLCTQAQFEWRLVFAQIALAMRQYGEKVYYEVNEGDAALVERSSAWQWGAIADLLAPVCYQTGQCAFKANFDRKCSIRERVDAFDDHNVPSTEWSNGVRGPDDGFLLLPIFPKEWLLDPAAAR